MASIRIHEDQENHINDTRRGKENHGLRENQGQILQQQKRAVLGVLQNNCHRNKPEIPSKDEKYPKAKSYLPHTAYDGIKVYDEKKDDCLFRIYEDKTEEEKSEVHREKIEINHKTITEVTVKTEHQILDVKTVSIVPAFRPALQDIKSTTYEETIYLEESPVSIDNKLSSIDYLNSDKKDIKAKREEARAIKSNFYDIEEYRVDIYNYLRIAETQHRPKPGYMKKQPDITYSMRSILVDWLVEVAEEYRLHSETLYLAVSYIDRFLSYMSVVRAKLQLVGTAAMFIAAKYEEIYPPDVGEFVYITDDTYSKKQVLRMEHLILRVLSFDLTVPTPLAFLRDYCISNNLSDKILFLAQYLCELSMLEADPYLQYLPSHLAAAAIAVARHTLQEEAWPHELELSSGYSFNQLRNCIAYLSKTFSNAPNIQQQAIQEKFKHSKYGHVALLLPRSTEVLSYEDESESA